MKATTKCYVDIMQAGIAILSNPSIGAAYVDSKTGYMHVWTGHQWMLALGSGKGATEREPKNFSPTVEQLEKHPALKQAWEEYVVIRKLLGI